MNSKGGSNGLKTLSASQTFAPAHHDDVGGLAVRAPAHAASIPSALIADRSLQDWVMEDLILMATVDGSLQAKDRRTGQHRWDLGADYPMVETTYYREGLSEDDPWTRMYWIIEPSENGAIYLLSAPYPGWKGAFERLNLTIKALVERSPYSVSRGLPDAVVYTAEQSNSMYSFDAKTGNLLASYDNEITDFEDKTTCYLPDSFGHSSQSRESLCKVEGSILLGRKTYTVRIRKRNGAPLCTIKYSEWIPNGGDADLRSQYSTSMDQSYVYTSYDGRVMALKSEGGSSKPLWTQHLSNPAVQVFDVVRPAHTELRDTELVLLPQPVSSPQGVSMAKANQDTSRVYVNQTARGSLFAMSEQSYPSVTAGAKDAKCSTPRWLESVHYSGQKVSGDALMQALTGVHQEGVFYSYEMGAIEGRTIASQQRLALDGREMNEVDSPQVRPVPVESNTIATPDASLNGNNLLMSFLSLFFGNGLPVLVLLLAAAAFLYRAEILGTLRRAPIIAPNATTVTTSKSPERASFEAPSSEKTLESVQAEVADGHSIDNATITEAEPLSKSEALGDGSASANEVSSLGVDASGAVEIAAAQAAEKESLTARVTIAEPSVSKGTEEMEGTEDATATEKKKARRGQRGGKTHRRKKKHNQAEQDNQAEHDGDGSMETAVEQALEINNDFQPAKIQPDPVVTQTNGDPTKVNDTELQIGNLTVFLDAILGFGSHGTRVFRGKFGVRDVAVKVMLKEFYDVASQEVSLLQESDNHRNVVRYFDKYTAGDFLYIALELCPATLAEVVDRQSDYLPLVGNNGLDRVDALRQITKGIHHLHSLKIVHRDIKPENILVAPGQKLVTRPDVIPRPRMLISDFGLCKKLDVNQSSFGATTAHAAGTSGWRAPELLVDDDDDDNTRLASTGTQHSTNSEPVVLDTATNRRATRAIDIFALGCIFFFVLSGGNHPFDGSARGERRYVRELNIIKGRHDLSDLSILGDYRGEAEDLIASMIAREPRFRPSAGQILAHPFFWLPSDRLEFLCSVSDQFESEPRDPPSRELQILESIAPVVLKDCNGDFLGRLPPAFLATLAKQRKYQGGRMLDVLRALRNKKNHYDDMPPNVKAITGDLPEGYLLFWTTRFPLLLMGCHQVVKDCGWHKNARFAKYYTLPDDE